MNTNIHGFFTKIQKAVRSSSTFPSALEKAAWITIPLRWVKGERILPIGRQTRSIYPLISVVPSQTARDTNTTVVSSFTVAMCRLKNRPSW